MSTAAAAELPVEALVNSVQKLQLQLSADSNADATNARAAEASGSATQPALAPAADEEEGSRPTVAAPAKSVADAHRAADAVGCEATARLIELSGADGVGVIISAVPAWRQSALSPRGG